MHREQSDHQSVTAKIAESRRPFQGDWILKDKALAADLMARADFALACFARLAARNVAFSPFLEIGAGSVARSLALMKHYGADGVACDISQGALRNAPYVQLLLRSQGSPLRVCCDAHHLPFLADSFRFVFAFRTLHHFDNPVPVVAECWRVLAAGGHFYCNEEPLDSALRRFLRGKRTLTFPPTPLQRLAYRLHLEKVFWDDGAPERAAGITEARFDAALWRATLAPFASVDMTVNSRLRIAADLRTPSLPNRLAAVVGGNVEALCRKDSGQKIHGDISDRLMCVDCGAALGRWTGAAPLRCSHCGREYPASSNVIRMLPKELEREIYACANDS